METRLPNEVDHIYADIREKIQSGLWKSGERMPSVRELAKDLHCSIGSVSKALTLLAHAGMVAQQRTKGGTRVIWDGAKSAETSARLDAYAFICASEQHEGIRRTANGFQDAARENDRRTLVLTTGKDYRKEAEIIGRLSEFDVKGAVIHPLLLTPEDHAHFAQLVVSSRFPIVLTINLPGLGCPSVVVDGFDMGYTMTNYLIQKGARRIGYLSNYMMAPFMRERYRGYQWALKMAGIEESAERVMLEPGMHPDFRNPLAEPMRLAEVFLKSAGKLDAVVCAYDYLAVGMLAAAKKMGISVPNDLMVTGVDDISLAAEAEVPLTTYRLNSEEQGHVLFNVLQSFLKGEIDGSSETRFRGEIVVRQSA
ncbi:MAG: hypothetical protein B9S32_09950 [Verrucomicrobia bacterium Tous-C9LFEB]|nr:MAG: hypothetical protein B9S32_09950 [Verrucomicrobia bacterium Tous-C9LFEB]